MSEVFDAVESDYLEPQDPEHFDTITQGMLDTFDGMESLSTAYTKAQEYLFACMSAADVLTYKQRVDGMEGVFSAIGEGLSAAWEYVKKLFKSVWGAFFGSGEDTIEAKAEKTEKVVENNGKELKALAKTGKTEKQVEGIRKKVKEKANKIQNDPKASSADKAKAKDIVKKVDEGNVKSTSQKEMDIGSMCEQLAGIDKASREGLIKSVGETEQQRRKYVEYVNKDRSSEIGKGRFNSMYKIFREALQQGVFHVSIPELVKVDSIKSILSASITQDKIQKNVEEHKKFAKFIHSEKAEFEAEIKELETALASDKKAGEVNGEKYSNKDQLRARLKAANAALSIVNATAGFQTKMLKSLERLSNQVKAIFGDYSDLVAII